MSCNSHPKYTEYLLELSEIADINYGSTVDGDSMYWVIYEEWHNDCMRHLLYVDKETYDSLDAALRVFQAADIADRDSLNKTYGFKLIRDSEGLHIGSIR